MRPGIVDEAHVAPAARSTLVAAAGETQVGSGLVDRGVRDGGADPVVGTVAGVVVDHDELQPVGGPVDLVEGADS
jgi:hypothetical protein